MKALYLTENKTESMLLTRMLTYNFSEIELSTVTCEDDFLKALQEGNSFSFFIIDTELRGSCSKNIIKSFTSLNKMAHLLITGNRNTVKACISEEFFNDSALRDILHKPFDRENILVDIKERLFPFIEQAREDEFNSSIIEVDNKDYISMKLRYFYLRNVFPYDVYLEISEDQYIKIITANKPYTFSQLHKYAKSNIKLLYIQKDDHLAYLESESLKMIALMNKKPANEKSHFLILLRSITLLHQYMLVLGVTKTISELMDETCKALLAFEQAHGHRIKKILKKCPLYYEGIASKSFMTALISVNLAKRMNWESRTTKLKMIACSILQDYSLPVESLTKINHPEDRRLEDYTDEERSQYYQHPINAAILARQFSQYTDIDYILEVHHEMPNKRGFPNQIVQSRFTTICCLFNVAQFLASSLDGAKVDQDYLDKVVREMKRDLSGGNFKLPFTHLEKLIA